MSVSVRRRWMFHLVASIWSSRSARKLLDLAQLVLVGRGELAVLLHRVHRLVEERAADHRAVVARVGDAQLLALLLELLQVLRVEASVLERFLHVVAEFLLLLVALEKLLHLFHLLAAQPVLDAHLSISYFIRAARISPTISAVSPDPDLNFSNVLPTVRCTRKPSL
jgi:hypothetical protein